MGGWAAVRLRKVGRDRADVVGPHHFVVFVLDDMAVPDVLAGQVEQCLHASDLAGVGDDSVLESRLGGVRGSRVTRIHRLAIDDLELHLVNVNGVRIRGEIVDFPDLDRVQRRVLGDRVVPAQRNPGAVRGHRAQQRAAIGVTPGTTCEDSSLSDTRRVVDAGPREGNAGRDNALGGTLVSVEESGTTTSFMTCPVVAGFGEGLGSPWNGSSGPSFTT